MICHVDLDGRFTKDIVGVVGEEFEKVLVGAEVLKSGSEAILSILRGMGSSPLVWEEKIKHKYPYDWKTGEPIIVL
jgi:isoleucyl-tRNA synthetase